MAAWASDPLRIVTASADQSARLWNATTGEELARFTQHTGPLYCLAVSADGRTLVTGAQDNTLRVWDLPLSHPFRVLHETGSNVTGLALAEEGRRLIVTTADRTVRVLDVSNPANASPIMTVKPDSPIGHAAEPVSMSVRSDNVCFATADTSGAIRLWSPEQDVPTGRWQAASTRVSAIEFPNNNQQLITGGDDGMVRLWQLMPTLPRVAAQLDDGIRRVLLLPGQTQAVVLTANGACRVIDTLTGQPVREFPNAGLPFTGVALEPNQSWIALTSANGLVRLFNFADASPRGQLGLPETAVESVAAHPDSRRLVTASVGGSVAVWNLPELHVVMTGHTAPVRGLAAAASGQWSVSVSDDLTARVWNSTGGATLALGPHQQPVHTVAIRDDDAAIATGDAAGVVSIWNPGSGAMDGIVKAHAGGVTAVTWTADRTTLVTAGADAIVRGWTLPLPTRIPADGEPAVVPAWEARSPDSAAVVQLATLAQDQGLLLLTAVGSQLHVMRSDGTAGPSYPSPGGTLRSIDVAASRTMVLAAGDAGQLHIFNANGEVQRTLGPFPGLTSARFDRDAARIVLSAGTNEVRIVGVSDGQTQERLSTSFAAAFADWMSPEQNSVVAAGAGNEAALIRQALVRVWNDFAPGAAAVLCSPDQQTVLVAQNDGVIRQLGLADGSTVRTFSGHTAAVQELAVSPDGQSLATGGDDGSLRLWNLGDASPRHELRHPQGVRSVAISGDNQRVATACLDGLVRVYEMATGQMLESFMEQAPGTAVTQVRFQNDNLSLLFGGDDRTLRSARCSALRAFPVHAAAIVDAAQCNGGSQIVTVSADGAVVLTNMGNGARDREFVASGRQPVCVAVRPDSQRVAAGCADGTVVVWNLNDGTHPLLVLSSSPGQSVRQLAWSPDGRKLAATTADQGVTVYGPSIQGVQPGVELLVHQQFTAATAVNSILFTTTGRGLLLGLAGGRIEEWSVASPEQRRQFNHGGPVYAVASSRDGAIVVSGSADQSLRVCDTETGQQKYQLTGHVGAVHAVALSADDTFAVSSGADGTLRLWDVVGGRPLKHIASFDSTMYSIAIHPNSQLLAAAGADRKVHLIDLASGVIQRTLAGHTDYVHSVAFSPNGEQILSYGYAGQLRLWNTADGQPLRERRIGRIGNTAMFSPDGRHLVTANGDGTASIVANQ